MSSQSRQVAIQCAPFREDELVDEDFRVAPCHRWHELLEDVAAFGVTPVMHDGMGKVCPRDLVGSVGDGSRFENVAHL